MAVAHEYQRYFLPLCGFLFQLLRLGAEVSVELLLGLVHRRSHGRGHQGGPSHAYLATAPAARLLCVNARLALDVLAVPIRVDAADALAQGWVCGEHLPQVVFDLAEEDMRHLRRPGRVHQGTGNIAADHFQRVANTIGAAGVLHRTGVRQELLLPADGGLDESRRQSSQPAQQPQGQAQQRHGTALAALAVAGPGTGAVTAAQQDVAHVADKGDALEHRRQTNIEAHVAIEDVTELVGNHPLQLVALELLDAAPGDCHHRICRGDARGKSIDPPLVVEHVYRWHRHVGRQCHLLDDIEAAALGGIPGLGQDAGAAHALRHHLAAGGQLYPLHQYHQGDRGGHRQTDGTEALPGEV